MVRVAPTAAEQAANKTAETIQGQLDRFRAPSESEAPGSML